MISDPKFDFMILGNITGFSPALTKFADAIDIRDVVSKLGFDHFDPLGREMRIATARSVRLDRQSNPTGGGANLQVQVNEIQRGMGSTVGQVVIPSMVFMRAKSNDKPNVTEHLTNKVRSALIESCKDGRSRTILEVH